MIQDLAEMVHKGTVDLSTRNNLSQTVPVISPNAKVDRVVPLGQA